MASVDGLVVILWIAIITVIVRTSADQVTLTVSTGQVAYLRPQDLNSVNPFRPNESCFVQVIQNEPVTQIFGQMTPKVFDCDFSYGRVIYEHFGFHPTATTTTMWRDRVKLRIIHFTGNLTRLHETEVVVLVINEDQGGHRRKAIVVIKGPLVVKEFFGLSRPIDHRVLKFHSDGAGRTLLCRVRLHLDRGWPRYGRMVIGSEHRVLTNEDLTAISCEEFLHLGLRYEHLRPPTPNMDYVGLLVEVLEDGAIEHREWIQLNVVIENALPNVPPRLSENSSLSFHVHFDSYGTNYLTPIVLSADDAESSPELVFFNLTKGFSPFQGHLYHVADNSRRSLTSFTQDDLVKKNIAYCPPAVLFFDRLTFQIHFDLLDSDYGVSVASATVNVELRRHDNASSSYKRPRITVLTGLIVLEGRSQPLQVDHHLRMSTSATSSSTVTKIAVIQGPKHGRLIVDGRQDPNPQFTWSQLKQELVIYEHDGDHVSGDLVHLKIVGEPDVLNVVLPIDIIPVDDSSPQLTINTGLKVVEGETVTINSVMLQATDIDSPTTDITYVVIEKPLHGVLHKHWLSLSATNFTQSDIDNGLVLYRHNGFGSDVDEFQLRLNDLNEPPNFSSLHYTVRVEINDGEQLRPVPTTSGHMYGSASVRETEILVLDANVLHYVHRNGRDADVAYDVIGSPRRFGQTTDGGKLVILSNSRGAINKLELSRLPETKSFQQHQVNSRLVAYVPPQADIGPTLLRVAVHFSVRERYGTGSLSGQHFNITVFPVNNKPPVLYTGLLVVFIGGSSIISTHALSAVDEDTSVEDLMITLSQLPNHGAVLLDKIPLTIGQNFTTSDVFHSRVSYVHRTADSSSDRIHVILTDGVHLVTGSVLVHLVPPRRDTNRQSEDQIADENDGLTVNEGDNIIITPEVLIGDVPDDESDSNAIFLVVQNPNLGSIQVRGKSNETFTQNDLVSGHVKYVHNRSIEIGRSSKLDDIRFMLVEPGSARAHQQGRSGSSVDEPVHTLRITILPVDNTAPYVQLGPGAPLVVAEGATVPLGSHVLQALDLDSKMEDVAFVVERSPVYGYLAHVLPARGLADVASPILNFRLADLDAETVHYVQSVHADGSEPKHDSFVLYALDGKHRSPKVTLNVTIIPLNDEPPVVTLKNFTVPLHSVKRLDEHIFNVSDADEPSDRILVRLQNPPFHGRLLLKVSGDAAPEFSEMDWKDSKFVSLLYSREGSSTAMDNFTLLISDGVHELTRTAFVEVVAVPRVFHSTESMQFRVTNKGLRDLVAGDARSIDNSLLSAERGVAVSPHLTRYVLRRAPRHGILQVFKPTMSWTNLTSGDIFTQLDINSFGLRYIHTDRRSQVENDDFGFTVFTDNSLSLLHAPIEEFHIQMKQNVGLIQFDEFTVTVEPFEVNVGGQVVLGPPRFWVDARNKNPSDVVFRIIVSPVNGRVIQSRQPNILLASFTLLDIYEEQIAYVHNGDKTASEDRFRIAVAILGSGSDTIRTANLFDVIVRISSPLFDTSDYRPVQPLALSPDNGYVNLKTMQFRATDPDAIYSLVKEPTFGSLLLDGRPVSVSTSSFAQRHVDNGRVAYNRHIGSGLNSDILYFKVTTSIARSTNIQLISMEIIMDTASHFEILPKLRLLSPEKLENFEGGLQGFKFSSDNIQLSFGVGSARSAAHRFRYIVKSHPHYGRLEKLVESTRLRNLGRAPPSPIQEFTEDDVDKGLIRYVLFAESASRVPSTNDSFELAILDQDDGGHLSVDSMELRWSLVYFHENVLSVCEDVGKLQLAVHRSASLDRSSSVDIEIIDGFDGGFGKAQHIHDYEISGRKRKVKFDPDVTSATWDIRIVDDGIQELEAEILVIQLKNPENAVIFGQGKVTINIFDNRQGSCFLASSQLFIDNSRVLTTTTTTPPSVSRFEWDNYWRPTTTTAAPFAASPVCNSQTIGAPLSITIGTTTINLVCDGKTWSSTSSDVRLSTETITSRPTVSPINDNRKSRRLAAKKSKSSKNNKEQM